MFINNKTFPLAFYLMMSKSCFISRSFYLFTKSLKKNNDLKVFKSDLEISVAKILKNLFKDVNYDFILFLFLLFSFLSIPT